MKTKIKIKEVSRLHFNEKGLMNVTLRDVAKSMNKSYGNITYHYATKKDVILSLFEDMNEELTNLQKPSESDDLLSYLLELPSLNYDITLKYVFFTIDYIEIKRNYPEIIEKANLLNEERKKKWKMLLQNLCFNNYFNNHLTENDLDYLMFLSFSIRSNYFQIKEQNSYNKIEYSSIVNKMLKPYLSSKGLKLYEKWVKST